MKTCVVFVPRDLLNLNLKLKLKGIWGRFRNAEFPLQPLQKHRNKGPLYHDRSAIFAKPM